MKTFVIVTLLASIAAEALALPAGALLLLQFFTKLGLTPFLLFIHPLINYTGLIITENRLINVVCLPGIEPDAPLYDSWRFHLITLSTVV